MLRVVISAAGISLSWCCLQLVFLIAGIPINRRPNRAHPTSRLARPYLPSAGAAATSGSLRSDARMRSGVGALAESVDTPLHSSAIIDVLCSSSDFAKSEASGDKAAYS